ncbi:hypothetical protein OJF2_01000 [Aquisphaera giovannonii]|uniref:Uncharacterized protein n=1 Tax=Aquisphaera giovannonii TaxID=406548 RepID=A0A5B9VV60_9BACT|nr:hypothetical protein [Aquisphaera giovannonii]QEH31635.1 hypothetical protein OJF2_01000 [Aquisphaera giovannonii]
MQAAVKRFVGPSILAAWGLVSPALAAGPGPNPPAVVAPPESFFRLVDPPHRDAARAFYKKYLDIEGMPVAAAGAVDDRALVRTREIVGSMLAGRPDVVRAMAEQKMYLIIIGRAQRYTDMPEYRDAPDPAFLNERVRGTGGRPTSFGEENLLSLPEDRYDDESIAVHEFAHTIDGVLGRLDPAWRGRLRATYRAAMAKGLYRDAYAASNAGEYWGEVVQSYFDCNRVNNWNHGPVGTREQLRAYDPEGYELVRGTLKLAPAQDWRYSWLQALPKVEAPPASRGFDAYYTKLTLARGFPVLGHAASDAALLRANEVIRRMFAYRHDILKALIDEGDRLVVLGRGESIADLPEWKAMTDDERAKADALARCLEYAPGRKLLVVAEEGVLGDRSAPLAGADPVVRVFAGAIHEGTGRRPVQPDRDPHARDIQQYELRVRRMDARFDARLNELFDASAAARKWRGTAAALGREAYWVEGVLAYFDAQGQVPAPEDADAPIATREALRAYDPGLFDLVATTMAHRGKVDWRLPRD